MANSKITFSDKVALTDDVSVSEINKITDKNINEIKRVVNQNADDNNTQFNNVNNSINTLQTSINNLGYRLSLVHYSSTTLSITKDSSSVSLSFPSSPLALVSVRLINSNRNGSYQYIQTQESDRDYHNIIKIWFYASDNQINYNGYVPIKVSDTTAKIMGGNWWQPTGSVEFNIYDIRIIKN